MCIGTAEGAIKTAQAGASPRGCTVVFPPRKPHMDAAAPLLRDDDLPGTLPEFAQRLGEQLSFCRTVTKGVAGQQDSRGR